MHRFGLTAALVLLLVVTFANKALAGVVVAGEKPRSTEIAELVDAYYKLDSDPGLKLLIKGHIEKLVNDERAREANVQRAMSWSNTSSNITFWIAHVLLATGLFAAALELLHSWRLRSKGKKQSYEIEVGFEKIALKSSMYGTLILLVSLFFYFMYLRFVYPVSYIS